MTAIDDTSARHRRLASAVAGILFLGSVVNYIDRSVLGIVKPLIQRDLSLNNTQYGLAVNAFLALYTVFYILGGRLADWLGYRLMFSLNTLFWSSACVLHALTRGLGSLCLFRGLLGVGEGGYYPAAIRGISEWFGPENRAKAVGVLLCGLSVGALVTPPIAAWITLRYGWRACFIFTGALGFILIPPWLLLHRRVGTFQTASAGERTEPPVGRTPLVYVLRHRKYLCVLSARALTDAVWLFYLFWMPGYFQEVRGFGLERVGWLLWIPFFCAGVGALAGAWASSNLVRRGSSVDRARKIVLLLSACLGALGASIPVISNSYLAIVIASGVCFAQLSWSSNIHTTITEITPPEHVAVLYGITGAAGNGLGALAQPLIGHIVDTTGYDPVFVVSGATYIAAMACVYAAGRIETIRRGHNDRS